MRKQHAEELTQALANLKSTLDAVSFQLDLKRGAFSQNHTFGLPFRWEAERAVSTTSDPNIFIRIPGDKAAFSFFCVDGPQTPPSAP